MRDDDLHRELDAIADQLCLAVDDDFSFRVRTESERVELQKLATLTNFLLESVEDNVSSLKNIQQDLEARVKERTRRLNLILRGAAVGFWEWDLHKREVRVVNSSLVVGSDETTLSLEDWLKRMHPADTGPFQNELHQHLNGLTPRFEARFRAADGYGGYRFFECRGISDRDRQSGDVLWMSGTLADITQQRFTDPATGLANADYFELIADEQLAKGKHAAMVMLSISNRNLLLESLPQKALKELTETFVSRLLTVIQPGQLLSSLSGGLYGLLVATDTEQSLQQQVKTLLRIFDEPFTVAEQRLWLSCLAGAVDMTANGISSAEEGIKAAQLALREVRNHQGSDYRLYQDSMRVVSQQRLNSEQLLRTALRHDWIAVYLQPLVDFEQGQINGYEALARIEHPDGEVIGPGHFIPVAEETGLVRQLTQVVMQKAVAMMSHPDMQALHPDGCTMSVNLSASELHDQNLPQSIATLLAHYGVPAQRLKLELTESAVMADPGAAIGIIHQFRKHGMKVALDDFGTGYSSLGYLRQLPLDILKIDRSLVSGLDQSPEQYAILEMILGLSGKLGLKVIVEGIESTEELLQVIALGGHFGQGYLFSRPVPFRDLGLAHQQVRQVFSTLK